MCWKLVYKEIWLRYIDIRKCGEGGTKYNQPSPKAI